MNPAGPLFFILLGVVVSNRLRGTIDDSKLSFMQTFLTDVGTTEEPISTIGWSSVGTDEPQTFYTTTVSPTPGNDITTVDPNTLVVRATVESSTVTGAIPASEDVMNMCNCASANIATLLGCDPPLASCAHG